MIDRIETGEVIGDKIRKTFWTGAKVPPKFHLYGKDEGTEYSIDRNIIYYENLYAGEDYVYGLYSGRRLDETETGHSSAIEIYSWDCTPVKLLHLDEPVAYFAVDEDTRTIYAVNPAMSEENILIFKF